jgi:hypothetical protein
VYSNIPISGPDEKAFANMTRPQEISDNTRAIFIISMGQEAAKTNLVERFVYSTRTLGQYSGYIVLLTDAPAERYDDMFHSIGLPNNNFITTSPLPSHYRTDFKQKDMVFKRFKTYVLDYIAADPRLMNVQLVYYLDVDIVVTRPLIELFLGLEQKYHIGNVAEETDKSTIWMFEGNAERVKVQGGQMILDVNQSKGCLTTWRKLIDKSRKIRKDQFPLMQMWKGQEKSNSNTCKIVRMAQDRFISFPSKQEVDVHVSEILAESTTASTNVMKNTMLIHIKNTGSAGNDVNETFHELFVRDILQFHLHQEDILGITHKMHIKALQSDMSKFQFSRH